MSQNFGTRVCPIVDVSLAVCAIETFGTGLLHRRTSMDVNTGILLNLAQHSPSLPLIHTVPPLPDTRISNDQTEYLRLPRARAS
jgi:hypothetical protein